MEEKVPNTAEAEGDAGEAEEGKKKKKKGAKEEAKEKGISSYTCTTLRNISKRDFHVLRGSQETISI